MCKSYFFNKTKISNIKIVDDKLYLVKNII